MTKQMMGSRELVRRAVLFRSPERVPRTLPWNWGSDILTVGLEEGERFFTPREQGEDEWGCVWQRVLSDRTMGQVKRHPLADYSAMKDYVFPDFTADARYDAARRRIAQNGGSKFVLGGLPVALNHRLEYLRGPMNALTDPYDHPEALAALLDRFAEINISVIHQYASIGGVDGVFWCDDWGLQDRLFVSPAIFRAFFKPRYKRIFDAAKRCGMLTFLHSCGNIVEILDDFIEAGLNVIQMDQQENMGLDLLSRRFGGRLCFWCPVDIQKTMVEGSDDDVRAYARSLIDKLGTFGGGFIAHWYAAPEAVNHSIERVNMMCREFCEYGGIFYQGKP